MFLKSALKANGFSLAEILVAMAIIAVIGAVAIPNLSKFNNDQQTRNTAAQIVSDLRKVQNNAHSGVKCPNNTTSNGWRLVVNNDNYILRCQDINLAVSDLQTVTITGATLLITCDITPDYVEFIKNSVSDNCTITVQASGSSQVITISKGGAIY